MTWSITLAEIWHFQITFKFSVEVDTVLNLLSLILNVTKPYCYICDNSCLETIK